MGWFIKCLKHYADFEGRASRKEYWMFYLFYNLFGFLFLSLDYTLGTVDPISKLAPISLSLGVLLLIPHLAVAVRRLHDVGKSGYMLFISLIPFVGIIWILIINVTKGETGDNKYGPDPLLTDE